MPRLGEPLPHIQASGCVYLDYNATTPIFPEAADEMRPFLTAFGNPSSAHAFGRPCKAAVDAARARVAAMVGADPDEIFFTSCGSESDNWAIWGAVMEARRQQRAAPDTSGAAAFLPHVVSSRIEHPAVIECLAMLAAQGLLEYTLVPVSCEGLVRVADVEAAMTPHTCLLTFMHSNNEVGSIQPVAQLAALARRAGALMHCDAAQSLGKVDVDVQQLGVDMLTVVAHKFGGPKGVAALYVRRGVRLERLLCGGGQEGGRRAGTENVVLVAGLGKAAELVSRELPATAAHMAAMRDSLQQQLLAGLPPSTALIHGPADDALRLPNTLSIGIRGIAAARLLAELSEQLAASAGAACHSGGGHGVSAVLQAMAVPTEHAVGTLRLSTGRHTTQQDVDRAAALILDYVQRHGGSS
ncbi:hypothetical protein CHLNCDRAFT_144931 [Chlorella variabilis]|uniref:Aminotransferase class V domain-containing protein n=1 Tax=Chlorella variabilis TaxID=554065 RepID=E1ZDB8_CHLVA|nr:hypothetical protein CHLNCDRAFT_144931 [Chlorella variabilis]EFN56195.1 hypothetical protein CHLNCDRAFT_144931 [Chlorella variabilis]|eukprot:XP_005848297.1 hypothetical protein CHLNCDRAFT_144931 [Chlorella variabilis]